MSKRALVVVAVAVIAASVVLFWQRLQKPGEENSPAEPASYVGRQACAPCHEQQLDLWRGSHHDLAMQVVEETRVLGDFDDATFTHFGVETTFYKSDRKFYARTEGPDGSWRVSHFNVANGPRFRHLEPTHLWLLKNFKRGSIN